MKDFIGLTDNEVQRRIEHHQVNDVKNRSDRSYGQIIITNILRPANFILLFSLLILIFLPQESFITKFSAALFVVLNVVVGLVQEIRAKKALERLAKLHVDTVMVIRDGKEFSIPISQIVLGDVIILRPGDRAVVDGPVLTSDSLEIDESFITGESEYIPKVTDDYITSGSFCVTGTGMMRAEKIGKESHLNQTASIAQSFKFEQTPLERDVNQLVRLLFLVVFIIVLALSLFQHVPQEQLIVEIIIVLNSLIPQGLIFGTTVSLTLGALKMSQQHALVHRMNAIESMGEITIICADKTGTLTENDLLLKEIIPLNSDEDEVKQKLYVFTETISWMNKTMLAIKNGLPKKEVEVKKTYEVPFTSDRKWSAVSLTDNITYILGAPDILTHEKTVLQKAHEISSQGKRVLLFDEYHGIIENDVLPKDRKTIALVVLEDQIRPNIKETLESFSHHHLPIKIISGDSAQTVQSIAVRSGLEVIGIVTEDELNQLDTNRFKTKVLQTNIFARITPEMKSRIVEVLQLTGERVAMIGDGVNDVAAMKKADLAIAMNAGSQITKDIADIVLITDDFSILPKILKEGEAIKQRMYAVINVFLPKIVYLSFLFFFATFSIIPFPLNLLQSTWLSFSVVGLPTALIIFSLIKPHLAHNFLIDILENSFVWGIIGGMSILGMITLNRILFLSTDTIEKTMIIVFISLYQSLLLGDIHGTNFFTMEKNWQKLGEFLFYLTFGLSIFVFVYVFPEIIQLNRLSIASLLLILLFLFIAYLLVTYLGKIRVRNLAKNMLHQIALT